MEREGKVASETHRVFFALWPDDAVRAAMAMAARAMHRVMHGRRTRDATLHLTLVFLGIVDGRQFARLQALPGSLLTGKFPLVFDTWACWPHNRIGWAGPSQVPEAMRALVGNLETWLRAAGFTLEQRPFTPHVTLIRGARCAAMPAPLAPIEWQVEELVLVRSQLLPQGAQYQHAARWPLA